MYEKTLKRILTNQLKEKELLQLIIDSFENIVINLDELNENQIEDLLKEIIENYDYDKIINLIIEDFICFCDNNNINYPNYPIYKLIEFLLFFTSYWIDFQLKVFLNEYLKNKFDVDNYSWEELLYLYE